MVYREVPDIFIGSFTKLHIYRTIMVHAYVHMFQGTFTCPNYRSIFKASNICSGPLLRPNIFSGPVSTSSYISRSTINTSAIFCLGMVVIRT